MDEFLKILKENQLPIEEKAARQLFQLCDRDGSGSIDRDETDGLFQMLKTVMPDVNLEREQEEEAVFEAAAAENNMSGKSTLTPTGTASVQISVHDV